MVVALMAIGVSIAFAPPVWGFFGHRLINKMAVFTLPGEMLPLYKKHINYISEHAVDPDKRRYATKNEAYRHYIDIDHWDTIPFKKVPRDFKSAILQNGALVGLSTEGDTTKLDPHIKDLDKFYDELIRTDRYSVNIPLDKNVIAAYLSTTEQYAEYLYMNEFVSYGVLPYFLNDFYNILVKVLASGDLDNILKVSADIGHYIADAHVPLHTTVNYNGQLTDQLGIHAFWESRLPELYAKESYDMMVGKAEYIVDKPPFFWKIILDSHQLLDEVLTQEKALKDQFPEDKQFCFDTRLERTVRIECPEYAKAYHEVLDGMVEERMQASILALGSIWYSAWIDAGQPDLSKFEDNRDLEELKKEQRELDAAANKNDIKGRSHSN